jgi:hypothetical protein
MRCCICRSLTIPFLAVLGLVLNEQAARADLNLGFAYDLVVLEGLGLVAYRRRHRL